MLTPTSLALAALFALSNALPNPPKHHQSRIRCPVIFDGRIPSNARLSSFDDPAISPYNTQFVKGENLTWSSILQLPSRLPSSRFDGPRTHRPLTVTIDDNSLFRAGDRLQTGFRRAGLLLADDANDEGADAADQGIVTFHWSVRQDASKPLNLTHEYMNVWHERGDYAGNQFTFSMGLLLPQDGGDGQNTKRKREQFRLQDRENRIVFEVPIRWREWQNFAVQLDYERSTLRVLYSEGNKKLKPVTRPLKNDNSGGGQLQIGMAKKPTETETVVFDGYHESIKGKEGQVYGGIFVEDSSDGCISV